MPALFVDQKPFIARLLNVADPRTDSGKTTLDEAEAKGFLKAVENEANIFLEKYFSDGNIAALQLKQNAKEKKGSGNYCGVNNV